MNVTTLYSIEWESILTVGRLHAFDCHPLMLGKLSKCISCMIRNEMKLIDLIQGSLEAFVTPLETSKSLMILGDEIVN